MKKALAGLALALGGSFVVMGPVLPAQAYPEITFDADVNHVQVSASDDLITHSEASVECDWTHEWGGKQQKGKGRTKDSTWSVPDVSEPTLMPVTFTCVYERSSGGKAAPTTATWTRTIDVTVVPRGTSGARVAAQARAAAQGSFGPTPVRATLPATGGPGWLVLPGGLVLIVLGGLAAWYARRRTVRA